MTHDMILLCIAVAILSGIFSGMTLHFLKMHFYDEKNDDGLYLVSYNASCESNSIWGGVPIVIHGKLCENTIKGLSEYISKDLDDRGIEHGRVAILNIVRLSDV